MPNGIQQIKNKRERQFARWLENHGRPYVHHPYFIRFGLDKYQPDFLLVDTGEYVDVVGSRQALSITRWKIEEVRRLGYKILLKKPDGSDYIQKKGRINGLPFNYRVGDCGVNTRKRFSPAPPNSIRYYRQRLGLRQYEVAEILGISFHYISMAEKAEEGSPKYRVRLSSEKLNEIQRRVFGLYINPPLMKNIIENGVAVKLKKRKAAACQA